MVDSYVELEELKAREMESVLPYLWLVGINIILPVRIPMYLHFDFSFTLVSCV